jgi:Rrf2 family iron-sulfur cluster assembly transcriptional regulator
MHLLAQEEYGLRCLLQVANGPSDRPMAISDIAEAEGLSLEFSAKLLRQLRIGGLLESRRGVSGGYWLTRPAEEISVWDALQVLGGTFLSDRFCEEHPGQATSCLRNSNCGIRPMWELIESSLRELLSKVNIAELNNGECCMRERLGMPGPMDSKHVAIAEKL